MQQIVVVGNGPVGYAFCEKLSRKNALDRFDVTVFGEEPRPAYDRVNLTKYFATSDQNALELAPRSWYEERKIELHTGDPVIEINREASEVRTRSGRTVRYDQLILATGSRPFVPPIEGTDLPGVFVYRTIEDLQKIQAYGDNVDSAVVLGGGLLGLEAAKALHDMQLDTHVIEMAAALMPKQLDNDAASLLQLRIEELGVRLHLVKRTKQIVATNRQLELRFDNGEPLQCGMVVISAGIRPRDELAKAAGLEIGFPAGVLVDDNLQTSDPKIYAIGECANHNEQIYGLIAPGWQMADVVVDRLLGNNASFQRGDTSTQLKLMGVNVTTIGDFLQVGTEYEHVARSGEGRYRKLILRKGKIVGAVIVGDDPELPRVREAVNFERRLWIWQRRRFMKTGRVWPESTGTHVSHWPSEAVVCSCTGVTRGCITEAQQNGCQTVTDLGLATKAGTICGSCRPMLAELVGQPGKVESSKGTRILGTVSVLTLALVALFWLIPPIQFADSVANDFYDVEYIWRESLPKQITGYTMLGLIVVGLTFSLRKRWWRVRFGNYGIWRAIHGCLGLLAVVLVFAHTGLHRGSNLNFWFLTLFLTLNLMGAIAGLAVALENTFSGSVAMTIRRWRPRLTQCHIYLFWPFPVMVGFHIFSVFYFG